MTDLSIDIELVGFVKVSLNRGVRGRGYFYECTKENLCFVRRTRPEQDLNKHNPLFLAHFTILDERHSDSPCPPLRPCNVMDFDVLAYSNSLVKRMKNHLGHVSRNTCAVPSALKSLFMPSNSFCNMVFSRRKLWRLTLRRLMSYIYGAPILDVSRSHTTTQHSR